MASASVVVTCDHIIPKSADCNIHFSGYGLKKNSIVKVELVPQKNQEKGRSPEETKGRGRLDLQHIDSDYHFSNYDPDNGFAFIDIQTWQETHGNNRNGCEQQTIASGSFSYRPCQANGFKLKYESDECSVTMNCKTNK